MKMTSDNGTLSEVIGRKTMNTSHELVILILRLVVPWLQSEGYSNDLILKLVEQSLVDKNGDNSFTRMLQHSVESRGHEGD